MPQADVAGVGRQADDGPAVLRLLNVTNIGLSAKYSPSQLVVLAARLSDGGALLQCPTHVTTFKGGFTMKRSLLLLLCCLVVVVLLAFGYAWLWQADQFQRDGTVRVAVLEQPVRVVRNHAALAAVPGAHLEAGVAAKDAVADERAKGFGDGALEFDGEIGDAAVPPARP